jgi:hypothetical protein
MRVVASQSGHMISVRVDVSKVLNVGATTGRPLGLADPLMPAGFAYIGRLGDTDVRLDAPTANLSARCYDPGRRNCSDPARGQ